MRGRRLIVGWIGAMIAGCYHPDIASNVPCSESGACPTGFECNAGICEPLGATDASSAIDALDIDACPAASCQGNDIMGCGAPVTCALGCSEVNGAHCKQLVPSNGLTPAMLVGATATVTGNDWDFDTDDGEIKKSNAILRPAGLGVIAGIGFQAVDGMGVFTANSFNVAQIDDFTATGDNALVLFAATTITVTGDIDVGGSGISGGPGGSDGTGFMSGNGCRGRAGRFFSSGFGEGGGGGGGRTAGGNGGASNQGASAGLGGVLCTTLPLTIPLRGGAGGGHGGGAPSNAGGGGGGAIALVAMESITVTGRIGAPGAGGASGSGATTPSGDGGGGGGGGGAVFLEAPRVSVSGVLTAHGGGGGAPFNGNGNRGVIDSAASAPGGSYNGVSGGRGGTGTVSPTSGGTYTESDATPTVIITRGAGGGGAAGRIEIKAATTPTLTGSTLSPGAAITTANLQ